MKESRARVLVVGGFHAGSQFAHAINTVKMAQGFARLGHEVGIVCRAPEKPIRDTSTLDHIYGLNSQVQWFLAPAWSGEKRRLAAYAMLQAHRFRPTFIYARNYALPCASSLMGFPTVAESHAHPSNRSKMFHRMIHSTRRPQFRRLVTISDYLSRHYQSLGVPKQKVQVLPDAVDLQLFGRSADIEQSPYPNDQTNVVYSGHLYDYKGIPTVLEAAKRSPSLLFHFVGGWDEDRGRQERRANELGLNNVKFHGLQAHGDVPRYLWHADVLLLPPSNNHPSAKWTSPVKLGEYLAAGVPVVATKIPALEAWVNDDHVEFAAPDDGQSLANAIDRVLMNESRKAMLIANGRAMSMRLSYQWRAERILYGLQATKAA